MKIIATVKPGSGRDAIEWQDEMHCTIWTRAKAQDNQANLAVIGILAKDTGIAPSLIEIRAGKTARVKTIFID